MVALLAAMWFHLGLHAPTLLIPFHVPPPSTTQMVAASFVRMLTQLGSPVLMRALLNLVLLGIISMD